MTVFQSYSNINIYIKKQQLPKWFHRWHRRVDPFESSWEEEGFIEEQMWKWRRCGVSTVRVREAGHVCEAGRRVTRDLNILCLISNEIKYKGALWLRTGSYRPHGLPVHVYQIQSTIYPCCLFASLHQYSSNK